MMVGEIGDDYSSSGTSEKYWSVETKAWKWEEMLFIRVYSA